MRRFNNYFTAFHPIVYTLVFGVALARIATSMSMPFLAIYLGSTTGMSAMMIGLVIGMGSLASTVGGFIGGNLSDRFGRRIIMFISLFTWSAVFVLFAVAEHPILFMVLNMLNGLCRSFFEPVSQALMADLTEPERRYKVFSMRYFAANVGVAIGPMIGAFFGLSGGSSVFLITGGIYLVYAIVLVVLLNHFGIKDIEDAKKDSRTTIAAAWKVVRQDVALRYVLLGAMVVAIGYSQHTVTLSQYLKDNFVDGVQLFAVLMTSNAITVIALQMLCSRLMEGRSPTLGIHLGNVFFALGFVGFAMSDSWTGWIISMIIFTIGEILNYPSGSMLMDRLAPEHLRGTYFGAQSFGSLGHFIGPWLGGLILTYTGGGTLFTIMAAIALSASVFYSTAQRIFDTKKQVNVQSNDGVSGNL
ncbi:MFS transporter [Paenibacillus sp. N1-5-1-14]|uniref:MDR family MFS transporter n=1 Tax=Paenibacillus radicibacter TaxID=2972488 RepID=UPI002159A7F5|nr:MFS transporter [Paenibacillus radicibacter]MCR8643861.1 MFS transporter [Paenibacillus radicibacter]